MTDCEAFLKRLVDNEDDEAARLVYADWLDENGEPDEADRQRKWTAAKAWIVDFARRWNFGYEAFGYEGFTLGTRRIEGQPARPDRGWRELVAAASELSGGEWDNFAVAEQINLHGKKELGEDHDLFWSNLQILTGKMFDYDHREKFGWSCSC